MILELVIALIVALAICGLVYWAITKIIAASGLGLPPVVMTVLQIVFVIIAVLILLKYVPPILNSLV